MTSDSSASTIAQATQELAAWAQRLYDAGYNDGHRDGYETGDLNGAERVTDRVTLALATGDNPAVAEEISSLATESALESESADIPTVDLSAVPLESLGLNARAYNALTANHIRTVGALVAKTKAELFALDNVGQGTITEIQVALSPYGQLASEA